MPAFHAKFSNLTINDGIQSKWYRKPMKKDIIEYATSAHSIITKLNIIKSMIPKRNQFLPVLIDQKPVINLNIARSNGYYNIPYLIYRSHYTKDLPILKIPFISDKFTRNQDITLKHLNQDITLKHLNQGITLKHLNQGITLKHLNLGITLKHLGIKAQIVITTPLTLRKLLIKSRIYEYKCTRISCDICDKTSSKMDGICQIKGCVYRIDCIECGQFYIGETMQHLYMRYNQHKGDIRPQD